MALTSKPERKPDRAAAPGGSRAPQTADSPPAGLPLFLQHAAAPGTTGDSYEREADALAQRAASPAAAPAERSSAEQAARPCGDEGEPLSPRVRTRIEPLLGADLAEVRVHTGSAAEAAAERLQARAFTHGNHISLAADQSAEDLQLMAHEATHVVQQGRESAAPEVQRQAKPGAGTRPVAKRPPPKPAGRVSYAADESFKKAKLTQRNLGNVVAMTKQTAVAAEVLADLEKAGALVEVRFVARKEDIPEGSGDAAGYTHELGENRFAVYVLAGQIDYSFVPDGHGGLQEKKSTVDRNAEDIAETLFHELLHAWFLTKFPDAEIRTGHTADVDPEVKAFGVTTYDEEQYDPRFLERLKKFEAEYKKLPKKPAQ